MSIGKPVSLTDDLVSQHTAVRVAAERFKNNREKTEFGLSGIDTGVHDLNMAIGGLIPTHFTVIAARSGIGKCLGYGTKVLMYNGKFKEVQDIKWGDRLMGPDSKPRTVISTCTGFDELYRVKQNRGIDYVVNSCHVLSLKERKDIQYSRKRDENGKRIVRRTIEAGKIVNIPLNEYLNKSSRWKMHHKGYKARIDFPYMDTVIDPYMLGLWLGDGTTAKGEITTMDHEVVDYMRSYANASGYSITEQVQENNKSNVYRVVNRDENGVKTEESSFFMKLKYYGLIGNKHIPREYLYNSVEVRKQLLAGIIDTDGYLSGNIYEVTQKSRKLAEDIVWLCNSLGYRAQIRDKKATIKSLGFECIVSRITISGNDLDQLPVRVERRKIKDLKNYVDKEVTGITVEPIGRGQYYGFELAEDDRRFLLEDFTVTHNTSILTPMVRASRRVQQGRRSEFLYLSWETKPEFFVEKMVCEELAITSLMLDVGAKLMTQEQYIRAQEAFRNAREIKVTYQTIPTNISTVRKIYKWFVDLCKQKSDREGVQVVPVMVIDYIQMAQLEGGVKNYAIADFVNGLKRLANENNGCVVALAQLNRGEADKNKPKRGDIKDCADIEFACDNLVLLHRPEYNNIDEFEDGTPAQGKMQLCTVKSRKIGPSERIINCEVKWNRFWQEGMPFNYQYWEEYTKPDFWYNHFGLAPKNQTVTQMSIAA